MYFLHFRTYLDLVLTLQVCVNCCLFDSKNEFENDSDKSCVEVHVFSTEKLQTIATDVCEWSNAALVTDSRIVARQAEVRDG